MKTRVNVCKLGNSDLATRDQPIPSRDLAALASVVLYCFQLHSQSSFVRRKPPHCYPYGGVPSFVQQIYKADSPLSALPYI
jgi:hypothetical protein